MTERRWSAEEGGAEPMSTNVEQWETQAATVIEQRVAAGLGEINIAIPPMPIREMMREAFAEIIAAHCPYSAAAVEELVRAAQSWMEESEAIFDGELGKDWSEHYGPAYAMLDRLRSALAALEKEKQHG